MDEISKILSLREVFSQTNTGESLETILGNLIAAACKYTDWKMGSIMAVDAAQGYGHVIARHDPSVIGAQLPGRWKLSTSPSLVALKRNEPVYIRDARESTQFPGYREDALQREYTTVMVMPMNCTDANGNPMALSLISRTIKELANIDEVFLGTIIHLGSIAVEREHRLAIQTLAADRLKQVFTAHTLLLEHVLSDGSAVSLSDLVREILSDPLVVVDLTDNQLIAGRSPDRDFKTDEAWQAAVSGVYSQQIMKVVHDSVAGRLTDPDHLTIDDGGEHHRFPVRIQPMIVEKQILGAVIVFPKTSEFSDLDNLLLESARLALSVQVMRNHIRFASASHVSTEILLDLVEGRWQNETEIRQRALSIGMDLREPQQMVVLDYARNPATMRSAAADVQRSLARVSKRYRTSYTSLTKDGRTICFFSGDTGEQRNQRSKLIHQLATELGRVLGDTLIIAIGGICLNLESYAVVSEECDRMIRIGRSFGLSGALSVQDFGPLTMLVGALDSSEVRAYVEESIGGMARHDQEHKTGYADTLAAYLREGCRAQASANAMGLHVSTLRYRLDRMRDLFGVNVDTPEKRFAAELAIQLHKLTKSV